MTATGTVYEGYRLIRPLGKGWLGEVYTAQNLDGAAISALRLITPELSSQPQVMTQFRRLFGKWRQLSHPNVLGVGELLEREHRVYYSMNLAQSGSARQLLQSQAQSGQFLDLLIAVDLVRQAAGALAYAHDANLMHGNLKPENLLLTPARAILGRSAYGVMVSDFGVGELQAFTHGVHDRLIVTTPAYMSPEQCRGVRNEVKSDIYSLGVILYELLTNLVPFETRDLADAIDKHQHVAPIPPGQIRLDIPQDLEEIVLTCLAKTPNYRYRSAHELEDALQAVLSSLLPQGPSPTLVLPDIPEPAAPRVEPLRDRKPYPRLQIVGDDGQLIKVEPLRDATVTIGRAAGNAVVLEHAGVSRHQVSLDIQEDGVFVTDLGSTNGTTLGGAALLARTRTPWPDGGLLRIEPFWLRLQPPQKVVQQARIGVLVHDNDISLRPGEPLTLKVQLANTGRTVDHFRLEIEGVPPEWVQNLYHEVQLNPGMTADTSLKIMVPRDAKYPADTYPAQVVARSRENPTEFGYAPMNWTVQPYSQTRTELTPRRRSAWRRTHYDLKIFNDSNVPVIYNPTISDDEGHVALEKPWDMLRMPTSGNLANVIPVRTIVYNYWMRLREGFGKVRIDALPQDVQVNPGSAFEHRIQVRLPIRWIASPRPRTLKLSTQPSIGQDQPESLSLLHLPVIPLWLLPVIVVLALGLGWWLLLPPNIVTVSVVPVDPQTQQASTSTQPNQQPRAGQPFYLAFETRNTTRIVVKPWNKTLLGGQGRLLIPDGITEPAQVQIVAYGRIKTTQQSLTITPKLPTPVIKLFSVSPENISSGQSATIRWDVGNAKEVSIDPLGTQPPKGEAKLKITGDTTIRLSVKGEGSESVERTRSIKVLPASIDLFEVTPAQAAAGKTVTVKWKVRNASNVTLEPFGTVEAQGSLPHTVTGDQVFTLRAEVNGQPLIKSATLKLLQPTLSNFSVSPQSVSVGDSVTLSWDVGNAANVKIDPLGSVPSKGKQQVVVRADTTFRLTAGNGSSSTELGSVSVSVATKPPIITRFSATPRKPRSGEPLTLEWQSQNAVSAELSGLPGQGTLALPASGSTSLTAPSEAAQLVLTIRNADGTTTSQGLALPVLPPAPKTVAPAPVAAPPKVVAPKVTVPKVVAPPTPPKVATPNPAPTPPKVQPAPRPATPAATVQPPQIVRFYALPVLVEPGQTVTLNWTVKNAKQVKLFPAGNVYSAASGKATVKLTKDTTFTLLAGTVKSSVVVRVRQASPAKPPAKTPDKTTAKPAAPPAPKAPAPKPNPPKVVQPPAPAAPKAPIPPRSFAPGDVVAPQPRPRNLPTLRLPTLSVAPVVEEFTITPSEVALGESVTLRWQVRGADRVNISGLGNQESSGELTLKPTSTTTYQLRATKGTKVSLESREVKVGPASGADTPPAPDDTAGQSGE